MTASTAQSVHNGHSGYLHVDMRAGVFQVSRRALVEQQVLDAERREIFDKCWLYLGHDSELAGPNAFLTRNVGGRELLFTRDGEGSVHAFLNSCPHRGARVTRDVRGVQPSFQCFYHGWVFRTNGKIRMIPDDTYAPGFKESGRADLMPVPRLETYRGFWFVNFEADVEKRTQTLAQYLGPACEYIDLVVDQAEHGLEVHEGVQEYDIHANWKLLLENSYDGYHGSSVHISYFEYLLNTNAAAKHPPGDTSHVKDLGNGHAVIEYEPPWGRPVAKWIPLFGEEGKVELKAVHQRLVNLHGQERADRIAFKSRNIGIFPNLVINDIGGLTVRTFQPVSPSHMKVLAFGFGAKGESAWARKYRLHNFLEFLGPGGFATADDAEVLEQCQKGFANNAETQWNDLSRGMHKLVPGISDESQMRAYWSMWDRTVAPSLAKKEAA